MDTWIYWWKHKVCSLKNKSRKAFAVSVWTKIEFASSQDFVMVKPHNSLHCLRWGQWWINWLKKPFWERRENEAGCVFLWRALKKKKKKKCHKFLGELKVVWAVWSAAQRQGWRWKEEPNMPEMKRRAWTVCHNLTACSNLPSNYTQILVV